MQQRIGPRASVVSFGFTTLVATVTAMGVFVLLDPRAQAFWGVRIGEAVDAVRGLFGLR